MYKHPCNLMINLHQKEMRALATSANKLCRSLVAIENLTTSICNINLYEFFV